MKAKNEDYLRGYVDGCADTTGMYPSDEKIGEWETGYLRYEYLRTLAPIHFSQLWNRCMREDRRFDDLVDELREQRYTLTEAGRREMVKEGK